MVLLTKYRNRLDITKRRDLRLFLTEMEPDVREDDPVVFGHLIMSNLHKPMSTSFFLKKAWRKYSMNSLVVFKAVAKKGVQCRNLCASLQLVHSPPPLETDASCLLSTPAQPDCNIGDMNHSNLAKSNLKLKAAALIHDSASGDCNIGVINHSTPAKSNFTLKPAALIHNCSSGDCNIGVINHSTPAKSNFTLKPAALIHNCSSGGGRHPMRANKNIQQDDSGSIMPVPLKLVDYFAHPSSIYMQRVSSLTFPRSPWYSLIQRSRQQVMLPTWLFLYQL
uniref:uncharacterized protein n=1 Tax=Myxine glutinosa TaxID=7769 RepID=UPI00358F6E56